MRRVVAKSSGTGAFGFRFGIGLALASLLAVGSSWGAPQLFPTVDLVDIDEAEGVAIFSGEVPEGFRHVVLEVEPAGDLESTWIPMVAGPLTGARASVLVRCPLGESERRFFRLKVGTEIDVPMSAVSGPEYLSVSYADAGNYVAANLEAGHVLNRVAYGPNADDLTWVESVGVPAYLEAQLDPASIDESGNSELNLASAALFIDYLAGGEGSALVSAGDACRFFRGVSEPPVGWAAPGFDDSAWESGVTGLGYGDGDDATVLEDMQGNYASVYVRQEFEVADPGAIEVLLLDIRYDDAFVAYLNGVEVARSSNIAGAPP